MARVCAAVLRFVMQMRSDPEPPGDPRRRESDVIPWVFCIIGVAMLVAIVAATTTLAAG